jgi:hypothetical protein
MANEFVVKNGLIAPNVQISGSTSGTTTLNSAATASGTLTLPAATDTLVGKATTDTLTNKSISGSTNTLTNIANSALTNSSITINGSAISLGGSATITAANPNALTIGTGLSGTSYNGSSAVTIAIDSTVATLTGTQTLTNKTLVDVNTEFIGSANNTKKLGLSASLIPASTKYTYSFPVVAADTNNTANAATGAGAVLVADLSVQTLYHKSLSDATTFFIDDVDGSKKMQFQLSGIAAGTTRTITVPNADINFTTGLGVANGGTGTTTLTANNVILGNGTSAVQFVAPGANGNVLTSNGTTWTSAAPTGGSQTYTIDGKTSAYTVLSTDLGKIINCTANTFSVSLTAAATLGSGFNCWIWNTGTGAITIDPSASETIDGATTLILRQNEGTQVVCDGTNWLTGGKKTMRGYTENIPSTYGKPIASGAGAIALGNRNGDTVYLSQATGTRAFAVNGYATANYSSAIGQTSAGLGAEANTGAGAMALGGSYASGADSFAAAVATNTSSYGATGANSIAFGYQAKGSGSQSSALGGNTALASGSNSVVVGGFTNTASGTGSVAFGGYYNTASASYSYASGYYASAAQYGKQVFASGRFAADGDAQAGKMVLRISTTNATPAVMTSDAGAASTTNQVILPNDSTYAFRILVVARRTDADNESAGYEFSGVVDRNANAASTAIVGTVAKTVLAEDTSAWDVNVTADTTNGGLKVEVTGEAAKTIRWVATVWTSEVTG